MKTTWQTKKLGEISDFSRGLTYSKSDEVDYSGTAVLRANNIDLNTYDLNLSDLRYIRNEVNVPNEKRVEMNSLLICTASGSKTHLGKIAYIDKNYNYAFGGFMGLLKPKKGIHPKYFFYNLISDNYKKFINQLSSGININNLRFDSLSEFEIPLPSLAEQKRIVKILDEVFEKIEKAKENTQKNLQNVRELFESYLQSLFANPGKDWEQRTLREICDELSAGGDVPKGNFSKTRSEKYSVPIFANGVKDKGLYGYTNIKKVIKPSITVSARGTIGYSEIRREPFFPIVRLIVLIPNEKMVDLLFLYYITRNFNFSNTGTSIPQLTIPMIENIKIALPPLEQQKTIVKRLAGLSVETKKLEQIYSQKLADLEELKKSILKKAFSGEL